MEKGGDAEARVLLIQETEADIAFSENSHIHHKRHQYGQGSWLVKILSAGVFLLLVTNIVSLTYIKTSSQRSCLPAAQYSLGVGKSNRPEGYYNPIYSSENETEADEVWNAPNLGHGVLAIDTQYALNTLRLGPTEVFPNDETKSIYVMPAYHVMHCVGWLHHYVKDVMKDDVELELHIHALHCLDKIRAEIMCTADDVVLPKQYMERDSKGTIRSCTNWAALNEFSTKYSSGYISDVQPGGPALDAYYPQSDGWTI